MPCRSVRHTSSDVCRLVSVYRTHIAVMATVAARTAAMRPTVVSHWLTYARTNSPYASSARPINVLHYMNMT